MNTNDKIQNLRKKMEKNCKLGSSSWDSFLSDPTTDDLSPLALYPPKILRERAVPCLFSTVHVFAGATFSCSYHSEQAAKAE